MLKKQMSRGVRDQTDPLGSPGAADGEELVRPQQRDISPRIDPGDSQRAEPIEFLNKGHKVCTEAAHLPSV